MSCIESGSAMVKLAKKLIGIVLGLLVVALVVLIVVITEIDRIVKHAVETLGPDVTGTTVTLGSADISVWSGEGSLTGLKISNPDGFDSAYAFRLGRIDVDIDIESLTSDVIIIDEITVDGASLIVEQKGLDKNNLQAILGNINSYSRPDAAAGSSEPSERRFIVREFTFSNGILSVVSDAVAINEEVEIPNVVVTGVGEKTSGATIAEVSQQLFQPVIDRAMAAAQQRLVDEATDRIKEELEEELQEELEDKLKGLLGGKDD